MVVDNRPRPSTGSGGQFRPGGQSQGLRPGQPRPGGLARPGQVARPMGGGSSSGPKPMGERKENPNTVYINDKIKAFEVIVIDDEDNNLGQMRRDQALRLAQEQGKDLVQMSYNPVDKVCTAKITDFGKYMYDKKRLVKEKKKTASKGMKQMKFAYGIGDNDLALKIKKVREMLGDGYTVRMVVQLKGRENIYKTKVIEKLIKTQDALADVARPQTPRPKEERNTFSIMLTPLKTK